MNDLEIVNSDRIKPLIENGIAKKIDSNFCAEFDSYLCQNYPFVKYNDKIDWEKVVSPYKRLNWQNADTIETIEFLKSTCLEKFSEVCVVYGYDEPGIIVSFDYASRYLEHITIFGWSTRFVVGVKRDKFNNISLLHDCFVEVDFAHWLTAPF